MKVIHYGLDYAKIEVNGEEFEVSIALAEAIEAEQNEQSRENVRQGRVDV